MRARVTTRFKIVIGMISFVRGRNLCRTRWGLLSVFAKRLSSESAASVEMASSAVYRPSHAVRRNSRGWVFAVQPSVQLHDARTEYARLITIRVESPASCRLRRIQRECANLLRLNCRIPSRNVPQIIICYGHEDYLRYAAGCYMSVLYVLWMML